jgi:hypothetical protein
MSRVDAVPKLVRNIDVTQGRNDRCKGFAGRDRLLIALPCATPKPSAIPVGLRGAASGMQAAASETHSAPCAAIRTIREAAGWKRPSIWSKSAGALSADDDMLTPMCSRRSYPRHAAVPQTPGAASVQVAGPAEAGRRAGRQCHDKGKCAVARRWGVWPAPSGLQTVGKIVHAAVLRRRSGERFCPPCPRWIHWSAR